MAPIDARVATMPIKKKPKCVSNQVGRPIEFKASQSSNLLTMQKLRDMAKARREKTKSKMQKERDAMQMLECPSQDKQPPRREDLAPLLAQVKQDLQSSNHGHQFTATLNIISNGLTASESAACGLQPILEKLLHSSSEPVQDNIRRIMKMWSSEDVVKNAPSTPVNRKKSLVQSAAPAQTAAKRRRV